MAASAQPVASSATQARESERLRNSSRTSIATVGSRTITLGALRHWVWLETNKQPGAPEPPEYTACISSTGASATTAAQTKEQLKRACEQRYEQASKSGLSSLIHTQWLVGEAAADGLEKARPSPDPSSTYDQLSSEIYGKLEREVPAITRAQVAAYYERHKQSFALPERRDLYVVRMGSLSEASKAKQEIEHGTSFAAIVKRDPLMQNEEAHGGLLRGLEPQNWPEPPLSKEVFRARVGTLNGPVRISLGFYVFKVVAIHPSRLQTLSEAEPGVAAQLHQALRDQIVSRFVAAFRRRWTARTNCLPGYVVQNCRQFKSSRTSARQAPDML